MPDPLRTLVIDTPPTSNGNLHVGHLAGPFLAADVYSRYLRADGRAVVLSSGTDDSQTYVLASARRKGIDPERLCATAWHEIRDTLADLAISLDGFAPYDDRYRRSVLEFVTTLHAAGKFRLRRVTLPCSARTGEVLVEGLVAGYCPTCLTESRGALCESCGHPIAPTGLEGPRSTVDPAEPVTTTTAEILVLPVEEYREQIVAFYRAQEGRLRPRTAQLVRELLARPLPDFPITYPVSWGIPAPFPETPGQVLNAWVEGIPAVMYCTEYAAERSGRPSATDDALWRADADSRIVYFIGFDNVWFWGVTHLALLLAHEGRYALPDAIVTNEFYELENRKFSTSLGHVLYLDDLLADLPRDVIRFYLALTGPENQRTGFSRSALDEIVSTRLVEPWNQLASELDKLVAEAGGDAAVPDTSPPAAALARSATLIARFRTCYELESYSPSRAADLLVDQVGRLLGAARRLAAAPRPDPAALGGLFVEVRALITAASPILVDLAAAAEAAGRFRCRFDAAEPVQPTLFRLPRLGREENRPCPS